MLKNDWTISTETRNGIVTGFAVMPEAPARAAPANGPAAERQTGCVAGRSSNHAVLRPMTSKR